MKKYLIFLCCLFWGFSAQSNTMCVANDTIAIVLDPTIGYVSCGALTDTSWKAGFPYGTIYGISACLSSNFGKSRGDVVIGLQDNGIPVHGGERNFDANNNSFCWCKITSPVMSGWIFYERTSYSACTSSCAGYCSNAFCRNVSNFRFNAFNTL